VLSLAQEVRDTAESSRKNRIFGLPVLYSTPETDWAFGIAGIYSFYLDKRLPRPETTISQFQLALVYTLNQQLLFYLPFDVFTSANRYRSNGEIGYYKYLYYYYGTGNGLEEYEGELYRADFPRIRLNFMKRYGEHVYLGLRFWLEDYTLREVVNAGLLDENTVAGADGSLSSGLGPVMQFDSRDVIFYPHKGQLLEASLVFNASWLGSEYRFTKFLFNGSRYLPISREMVLALNAYVEVNIGTTPFNQMALLGGGRKLRGYYEGRYRDNNLMILQAEGRFPIWKRFKGAIFGGAGMVAEKAHAFSFAHLRPAFGAGLRYLALKKEQIHIRFDLAWGQRSNAYYLTIGEAF
jgi:outer membrane protein assembly factor BamA